MNDAILNLDSADMRKARGEARWLLSNAATAGMAVTLILGSVYYGRGHLIPPLWFIVFGVWCLAAGILFAASLMRTVRSINRRINPVRIVGVSVLSFLCGGAFAALLYFAGVQLSTIISNNSVRAIIILSGFAAAIWLIGSITLPILINRKTVI